MPRARKGISPRMRFEIFKRDGFRCVYCGLGFRDGTLVVDHITPVALGGGTESSNLATACEPCNAGKGAEPLPEAYQWRLQARISLAENEGLYVGWSVDDLLKLWATMPEGP